MKKVALAAVMAAMLGSVASAGQVTINNNGWYNLNISFNERVEYLSGESNIVKQDTHVSAGQTKTFNTTGQFSVQVGCAGHGYTSFLTEHSNYISSHGNCWGGAWYDVHKR